MKDIIEYKYGRVYSIVHGKLYGRLHGELYGRLHTRVHDRVNSRKNGEVYVYGGVYKILKNKNIPKAQK